MEPDAPEVWQRTMHEFVEDLERVEVIADDFLIAGFGIGDREDMSTLFSRNAACGTWNWIMPEWNSTSEAWNSSVSYPPLRAWEDPGHIADAWT